MLSLFKRIGKLWRMSGEGNHNDIIKVIDSVLKPSKVPKMAQIIKRNKKDEIDQFLTEELK